jgi:magnesium transporter
MTSTSESGGPAFLGDAIDCLATLPVDQLRCYRIDTDRRCLVAITPLQLSKEWADKPEEVWIDIQASQPTLFQEFLEKLNLHPLIIEDCLDPYRSSRFSSYDTSLHFEFPVFATDSVDDYLSVICVPRLLITIRTTPIPAIDSILENLDALVRLNDGTKSALLYAMLDALGDCLVHAARNGRSEIRQLSQSMDKNPDTVDFEKIISVKRRLQDITMIAEDQLYCVRALIAGDSDALPISSQRDYLRDAVRNYETALRVVHQYESRTTELYQQYLLSLQAKTEARIRILTILSSICLPLTLIAGIYGMNFARMPETQWPWGYPAILAAMFVIAVGQLVFFYKRGWLG